MADFAEYSQFKPGLDEKNPNISNKIPDCMIECVPPGDMGRSVLTKEQWNEAKTELVNKEFVSLKYPRTVKLHSDPPIGGQFMGLITFIPAKNAVPDKEGCFGVLKLRGNFESEASADKYSEYLIRQHDSYAVIDYCYVGKNFPLMVDNTAYRGATKEIDIRKKVDDTVRNDIKEKRAQEKIDMDSIQERHRALMADIEEEKNSNFDDLEFYVQLRVKRANLLFRRDDLKKKIDESESLADKVAEEIKNLNTSHPEYKEQYIARYLEALHSSGIDPKSNPIMAYLHEDDEKNFNKVSDSLETKDEKSNEL